MKNEIRQIQYVTAVGLVINLVLVAFKFVGGILGGSQALIADAVHSLSDMISDIAIIVGAEFWSRKADHKHPHGHKRIETLVTVFLGILLVIVAVGILWESLSTLDVKKHQEKLGVLAFVAALTSIVLKELLYRWTLMKGRKLKSAPLVANAWHHRSDAFSSIPVAIAVAGAYLVPTWSFLDPLGAVVVSIFIFQAAYKILVPAYNKLIDAGLSKQEVDAIRKISLKHPEVKDVHKIRTRYLGCSDVSVDMHMLVDPEMSVDNSHDIAEQLKYELIDNVDNIMDVVVHVEPFHPKN